MILALSLTHGYLANLTSQTFDRNALRSHRCKRKLALVADEALLPGIQDATDHAKNYGLILGVASSSSRQCVVGHLDRLGVTTFFDTIVGSNDVERVKPAPDLYRTAVSRLSVLPIEAIAVEDAIHALWAANAAGLMCIAIPNNFLRN